MINETHLFPSRCKVSKLTFLPTRTIFSLDFLAKFCERALEDAFLELTPPDTHGQFAYHADRSCELLVAIGLDAAERNGYAVAGFELDQIKAFDSGNWSTMTAEYQRLYGAGKMMHNYFGKPGERYYFYRGIRGFAEKPMGRGAIPGSIIAPRAFAKFQCTDIEMTKHSTIGAWLEPGLFSDDKQPLAEWESIQDGRAQRALQSSWDWSQKQHVSYHLSGKKRPKCFLIRPAGVRVGIDIDISLLTSLKLGVTTIERTFECWQLGICQRFPADDAPSNEFGYELVWQAKNSCFDRLATRFQEKKHTWEPEFLRVTAMAYMVGQMNYGSSLYWCRATVENKEHVRFLYCKVLAACMGLETSELLSLSQCKSKRVKEKNTRYIRACEFMNMPTLKDLAIKNARNLVRQWGIYDPLRFTWDLEGKEITGLADAYEDKLCSDAVGLSFEDINDWYPEHTIAKSNRERLAALPKMKFPQFVQTYDKAVIKTNKVFEALGSKPEITDYINTYIMTTREFFKANEFYHRSSKMLDPIGKIEKVRKRKMKSVSDKSKRRKVDTASQQLPVNSPDPITRARAPAQVLQSNMPAVSTPVRPQIRRFWDGTPICCSIRAPARKGRRTYMCRICGYTIPKKEIGNHNKLDCCGKLMHISCWEISVPIAKRGLKRCENIEKLLEKDGTAVPVKEKKKSTVLASTNAFASSQGASNGENSVICMYCNDDVSIIDKNHLGKNCPKLNAVLTRAGMRSTRMFDPGKPENFGDCLSPVATRSAAATAVSKLTGTPGCGKDV